MIIPVTHQQILHFPAPHSAFLIKRFSFVRRTALLNIKCLAHEDPFVLESMNRGHRLSGRCGHIKGILRSLKAKGEDGWGKGRWWWTRGTRLMTFIKWPCLGLLTHQCHVISRIGAGNGKHAILGKYLSQEDSIIPSNGHRLHCCIRIWPVGP